MRSNIYFYFYLPLHLLIFVFFFEYEVPFTVCIFPRNFIMKLVQDTFNDSTWNFLGITSEITPDTHQWISSEIPPKILSQNSQENPAIHPVKDIFKNSNNDSFRDVSSDFLGFHLELFSFSKISSKNFSKGIFRRYSSQRFIL